MDVSFVACAMLVLPAGNSVTGKALLVMDRESSATSYTTVSRILISNECEDAEIADIFKIPNWAHAVGSTIASVKAGESLARILRALKTEPDLVLRKQFALSFQVCALFVAGPASRAMTDLATLLWNAVNVRQIERA